MTPHKIPSTTCFVLSEGQHHKVHVELWHIVKKKVSPSQHHFKRCQNLISIDASLKFHCLHLSLDITVGQENTATFPEPPLASVFKVGDSGGGFQLDFFFFILL